MTAALKQKLDEKGQTGWELAAVVNDGNEKIAVFKRAVTEIANILKS